MKKYKLILNILVIITDIILIVTIIRRQKKE